MLFQIISDPFPPIEGIFFPQKRWNSKTGLTKMSGIPRAVDIKTKTKSWNSETIPKKKSLEFQHPLGAHESGIPAKAGIPGGQE